MKKRKPILLYIATKTLFIRREGEAICKIEIEENKIEVAIKRAFEKVNASVGEILSIYLDIKTGASEELTEGKIRPAVENMTDAKGNKVIKEIIAVDYIGKHKLNVHLGENASSEVMVIYKDTIEIVKFVEGEVSYGKKVLIFGGNSGGYIKEQYEQYMKTIARTEDEVVLLENNDTQDPLSMAIEDFMHNLPEEKKNIFSSDSLLICPMFEVDLPQDLTNIYTYEETIGIRDVSIVAI